MDFSFMNKRPNERAVDKEIKQANKDAKTKQQAAEKAQTELEKQESSLEEARRLEKEDRDALENAQKALKEAEDNLKNLEESGLSGSGFEKDKSEAQGKINDINKDIERLQTSVSSRESNTKTIQGLYDDAKKEADTAKTEADAAKADADAKANSREEAIAVKDASDTMEDKKTAFEDAQKKTEEIDSKLQAKMTELENKKKEQEELESGIETNTKQRDDAKENGWTNSESALNEQIEKDGESLTQIKNEISNLEAEIKTLDAEKSDQHKLQTTAQNEYSDAKGEVSNKQDALLAKQGKEPQEKETMLADAETETKTEPPKKTLSVSGKSIDKDDPTADKKKMREFGSEKEGKILADAKTEQKEDKSVEHDATSITDKNVQSQQAPEQQKESVKDEKSEAERLEGLADEVNKGKFGNGDARKEALGDDYDKVQSIINERYAKMASQELNISDIVPTTQASAGLSLD